MKQEALVFVALISICCVVVVDSKCSKGCHLALASYYVWPRSSLWNISQLLQCTMNDLLIYNPQIPNADTVTADTRINIPFSCDCINGDFLGHVFAYASKFGDTYDKVAISRYVNLTTPEWLQRFNVYDRNWIPYDALFNVTVNCSFGVREVSEDYGLFVTYPLRQGKSLGFIAVQSNISENLLQSYNPGTNFSGGSGLVFIPGKDDPACHSMYTLESSVTTKNEICCGRPDESHIFNRRLGCCSLYGNQALPNLMPGNQKLKKCQHI